MSNFLRAFGRFLIVELWPVAIDDAWPVASWTVLDIGDELLIVNEWTGEGFPINTNNNNGGK